MGRRGLGVLGGVAGAAADRHGQRGQLHEALAGPAQRLLLDVNVGHFERLFGGYVLEELDEIEVFGVHGDGLQRNVQTTLNFHCFRKTVYLIETIFTTLLERIVLILKSNRL